MQSKVQTTQNGNETGKLPTKGVACETLPVPQFACKTHEHGKSRVGEGRVCTRGGRHSEPRGPVLLPEGDQTKLQSSGVVQQEAGAVSTDHKNDHIWR